MVNMTAAMSAFEQFDVNCDINCQASRWEYYIDRYEDYCLAFDVTDATEHGSKRHSLQAVELSQ